jgi:hypothetical protein
MTQTRDKIDNIRAKMMSKKQLNPNPWCAFTPSRYLFSPYESERYKCPFSKKETSIAGKDMNMNYKKHRWLYL